MVRYQLENMFVNKLKQTEIPYDIITVIESFLPKAPNMNDIDFIKMAESGVELSFGAGYEILRTEKKKKTKYVKNRPNFRRLYVDDDEDEYEDDIFESEAVMNLEKDRYLTYDFGEFCCVHAILIKTNFDSGFGRHVNQNGNYMGLY